MTEKSKFGKGLVICLVKFAEHFEKKGGYVGFNQLLMGALNEDPKMCDKVYDSDKEKFLSSRIEMWANGASVHLYEIEVPEGKDWNRIRAKVKKLQDKGLEIGHGFTDQTWTKEDFFELRYLTREIALMIDRKLGLKPQLGEW